ncbi:hypothetical protein Rsub_00441 [Raphidocelis subcapitata]|uniref:DNA-directed primase/polymerase protein n=1 Tax=Raphidocelis subcapitata TaxID=307507 RepID=A0A2V0NQB8_9CHLO|nr:hypothetical protein Rsub_00441 [Raphidocelis subcapitata]|eukprot:GBF87730.1 hypothetical protein Rsub_00441 [Raphidocelis subcapitata]
MIFTPNSASALVPKVLSSRFHATAKTARSGGGGGPRGGEPSAKRPRLSGGGGGFASGGDSPGRGGADGAANPSAASDAALSIFRTFPTQQAAFDFWDSQRRAAHLLRLFAVERDSSGRRAFIVAAPQRFWAEYKALPHAQRNHYEIIRQGCPCHLYFDLEFVPALNPGLDGSALVALLVEEVREALAAQFDAVLHPSMALELDSTTPQKWSRHLIIRLPGLAFADNAHAGAFVRLVALRALRKARHSTAHAGLVVAAKGGGSTLAIDMGVYTRNRAFRLHLSSKAGRESHLRATPRFGGAARDPREFFFDSLITSTPFGPWREAAGAGAAAAAGEEARAGEEGAAGGREFGREWQQTQLQAQAQQQAQAQTQAQQQAQTQQWQHWQQPAGGGEGAENAPFAAAPPPPKVTWLPAWRLQQQAAGAGPAACPPGAAPQGPCCLPSPLGAHHNRRGSGAAAAAAAAHHHRRRHGGGGGGGGAAAPRPVSLLRCEGIDWRALLAELPPQWQALAALHHSVVPGPGGGGGPGSGGGGGGGAGGGSGAAQRGGGGWHDAGEARPAPSPFADVDAFIESVVTQGGAQGCVRSWVYARASGSLLLCIKGNRWCGNVGRQHRSNGVYYSVDLIGGTWHQRCYDPECRAYRSECMPLPLPVWERHRDNAAAAAASAAAAAAAAAAGSLSFGPQHGCWGQQQQQHAASLGCAGSGGGSGSSSWAPAWPSAAASGSGAAAGASCGANPPAPTPGPSGPPQPRPAAGAEGEDEEASLLRVLDEFERQIRVRSASTTPVAPAGGGCPGGAAPHGTPAAPPGGGGAPRTPAPFGFVYSETPGAAAGFASPGSGGGGSGFGGGFGGGGFGGGGGRMDVDCGRCEGLGDDDEAAFEALAHYEAAAAATRARAAACCAAGAR